MSSDKESRRGEGGGLVTNHPVLANFIIILLVGFIGIWIAYLALNLFTNHGASDEVPSVENMSYTQAIETLHAAHFRVDIRDSLYNEEYKPGFVIEQFPKAGARVKPGRRIFLYINAVHPREVIIDGDNRPAEDALSGYSYRQGKAQLEELGFKNVQTVWVSGETDRVINLTLNGRPVKKMQKVPLNANLVLRVYDGKLKEQADSIQTEEYLQMLREDLEDEGNSTEEDYSEPV